MEKNLESIFVNLFDKTREISGIGVWHVDLVNESVYWDDNTKRIHEVPLDFKPDLASGINFYKEGFSRDEIQRLCGEIIENGTPYTTELIVVTQTGKDVWVRAVARPQEENGEIVGFYGTFQDITKEKETLKEITDLKERSELASAAGNVGIWDWDVLNNELVWDNQMYNLYGIKPQDFSGAYEAWQSGLHPEDKEPGDTLIQRVLAGELDFDTQFRVVWPSGEIRHIKAKAKVYRNGKGEPLRMVGTNWDITDEINKTIEINDYFHKMKIVQEGLNIAMWKWDPVTGEAEWDDELFEMYGISKDSPDKIAEWEKRLEPEVAQEIWADLALAMEGKQEYDKTFKVILDGEVKYVRGKAEVIRKPNGEVDYLLGSNIDVTEEVESQKRLEKHNEELQELSEKLQRSNEQLEEFAYVASHDLKTPIRNMSHYASFIEEDYGEHLDEEGIKMINGIKDQAQRMTNLVDDLLTYSRVNKMKLTANEAPMNSLVNEVVELLGVESMPDVEVVVEDLGELKVDIVKMREVFNNLITNGIKYNDNDSKEINIWREGNLVYVKDNGIGIDESMKDKVFAFFKRLHAKDEYGGGTGAGMAIVQKVLDRHNATIDFQSKIGEGTTFILDFSKTN